MSKKDGSITIRNLTAEQYNWLEQEAKRTGLTISAVFKVWVQKQIEDKMQDREEAEHGTV